MKKYEKQMTEEEYKEFLKRYDQFKDCSLPCHFWDEERQTSEYVWFQDGRVEVENEIFEALGNVSMTGLYYPYIDKHLEGKLEDGIGKWVTVIGHNHGHSFNDVVKALYNSPESFKIEKKDYKYYSKQELEYLDEVQKRLLFIGLKDNVRKTYRKESLTRYKNKKQKKIAGVPVWHISNENIEMIKNGKLDYIIGDWYKWYDNYLGITEPFNVLIVDDNKDFRLLVKIIKEEIILHKDIKNYSLTKKYKPNKKFIAKYFKVIEIFE